VELRMLSLYQALQRGFQEDNDDDDNTDGNKTSNTYNHRTKWIGVPNSMQVSLYDIQPSNHPTGTVLLAAAISTATIIPQ
jgi:hypothetical protein